MGKTTLQDLLNKAKASNAQIATNNAALKAAEANVTQDSSSLKSADTAKQKASDALTAADKARQHAEYLLKSYCQPYVAGYMNNPYGNSGNYYIHDTEVYTKAPSGHTLTEPTSLPPTYLNQYLAVKLAYEDSKTAYQTAQTNQVNAVSKYNTLLHKQSVDQDFVKQTLLAISSGKKLPVLNTKAYNGEGGSATWKGTDQGSNPPLVNGDPAPYIYNAPMTSSAYFKFGPQFQSTNSNQIITDPGAWTNAQTAWRPGKDGTFTGAKGVIQMSQALTADISIGVNKTGKKIASGLKPDTNSYGFKFLYNPTSVGMSWGIVETFSPSFEQTGQDIATPIGAGLLASTVTFSLVLNRIEDMMYIKDDSGAYITDNAYPYPSSVDPKERGLIWNKGTMYDLEYLFKTTGGYNSEYISSLNGVTADKGWLMPTPVELHLGSTLRYLVRVSALDINHAIFNERMVPIFTTVNLTCTRYYDTAVLNNANKFVSGS
jgi:hypothetical protein